MASVVDICNRALDKLGYGSITSLDDGTKAANLCSRAWPLTRDQVLRDHPWNFAVKRVITSPVTATPVWGFAYQHPLPADLLRLLDVKDLSTRDYQVEGQFILTNDSALYVRYIQRITDPNQFDALFLEAVTVRLAFEMCETLTQSNQKKDSLWGEYDDALTRAKRVYAQENPPVIFEEDDWISVRY